MNHDRPPGEVTPMPGLLYWLFAFELCAIGVILFIYLLNVTSSFVVPSLLLFVALGLYSFFTDSMTYFSFQLLSTACLIIIAHYYDNNNASPRLEYVFAILLFGFPALILISSIYLGTAESCNQTDESQDAGENSERLSAFFLGILNLLGIGCGLLYEWLSDHEQFRAPAPRVGNSISLRNILSQLIISVTSFIPSYVLVFFIVFRGVEGSFAQKTAELDKLLEFGPMATYIGIIVGFVSYIIISAKWTMAGRKQWVLQVALSASFVLVLICVFCGRFTTNNELHSKKGFYESYSNIIMMVFCVLVGIPFHLLLHLYGCQQKIKSIFDQSRNRVNAGVGGAGAGGAGGAVAAARNNQPQNMREMPARGFDRHLY